MTNETKNDVSNAPENELPNPNRWATRLPLDKWLELEKSAREIDRALEKLHSRIGQLAMDCLKSPNAQLATALAIASERVHDARQSLFAHNFHVQTEWTGGGSDDPRNYTLREPNWVTIPWVFPKDQVDEYRDEDGEITIPHRRKKEIPFPVSASPEPNPNDNSLYITSCNRGPIAVVIKVESTSAIRKDYVDVIVDAINDLAPKARS